MPILTIPCLCLTRLIDYDYLVAEVITHDKEGETVAYSELIKNFERIRGYMRDFYVYGFKHREQYDRKSARSYDNERRRVESWLGDYMAFRQDKEGKTVFLTVDNRSVPHNPLYKAFRTKSFTANDITLHFYLLDLLAGGESFKAKEIMDHIDKDYLSQSQFKESREIPDESTLRKKLKEYEQLGLLERTRSGRESAYRIAVDQVDLAAWKTTVNFFSETDPLGVVGSYILDRYDEVPARFNYKHHYLLNALDSEVLYQLLEAIREHRITDITSFITRRKKERVNTVLPMKIFVSTQTGRQYLLAYHYGLCHPIFLRLDNIRTVRAEAVEENIDRYDSIPDKLRENLWGASLGPGHTLEELKMTVHVGPGEEYILERLEREKRCGRIEPSGNGLYTFTAMVYDASELLPWLRTFIGRIANLNCSNEAITQQFYADLKTMHEMYGGDGHAVQ